MLSDDLLHKIEVGEITSRNKLWKELGYRDTKIAQWLTEQNILVPKQWNKSRVMQALSAFDKPTSIDVPPDLLSAAKRHFGSWNNALAATFGTVNQKRYAHTSDEALLTYIVRFVQKYQRLPNRNEFDGNEYPYWETYYLRFGVNRWSDVIGLVDLDMTYYAQHGWGKKTIYNGRVYLSKEELLIGKYLTKRNITFDKEVPYGNSNHIFDFYLIPYDVYVEYYGIGTQDYQERIDEKRSYYEGRTVIEIFKHENTIAKLDSEVQRLH